MSARPALVAALAALAGATWGCGGSPPAEPTLDVVWLQRDLVPRMKRETATAVEHVACPPVAPRAGRTIECSAAFNGEPGLVEVTLLDSGVRPRYRTRLKNLLRGPLERAIQARLIRAGFPVAAVDCPGPIPQRRGAAFTCRVEDSRGRDAELRVEQVDDRGHVRFQPLRRAPAAR